MTRTPPPHAALARRILTERQYLAWVMREMGTSEQAVALMMRVSRRTVRGHVAEAKAKIDQELADAEDQNRRAATRR